MIVMNPRDCFESELKIAAPKAEETALRRPA
jgi:hypothetical protein